MESDCEYVIYAPRDRFLALLAQGWRLPEIVEPIHGHHGYYSIILWRGDELQAKAREDEAAQAWE